MKFSAVILLCLLCTAVNAADNIQRQLQENSPVWYDTNTDQLKRAQVKIPTERDESGESGLFADIMLALIYSVIIGLIAYLIYLFVSHFVRHVDLGPKIEVTPQQAQHVKHIQVSDLPFQTNAELDDLRSALDTSYQQSNWPQVAMYALLLLLTEFHKAQYLHLRRGKTNRLYMQEMHAAPESFQHILKLSIQLFERSFFGHCTLESQQAQNLYNEVCRAHKHLQDQQHEVRHA